MQVGLLGPLALDPSNGQLGPRDRVVLSVLALHAGEVVSAERLADALWGDDPPQSAAKVVQGCVVRLRKSLGAGRIETRGAGYRLVLGAGDELDVHQFERLVGKAREQLALRAPDRALRTAEEALAVWRGRPFDELEGFEPARIEATRLEELRHEAEELHVDAALRAGRHHEVLATARALVDAAPTREQRWELLALAQYRSGSQADALRTLHDARRHLGMELGLEPGPGIVELESAILRQDGDLRAPTIPAVVDGTCPWPGLLAYSAEHAEDFAGRAAESEECLARLASDGVLVIVGPSGSGKSSLARAGIAGALERDGRRVGVVTPGSMPATSLERAATVDVLVVDQCEEAVTLCLDPDERDEFLTELVEQAGRAPLVVVLRADRLGEISSHPGFARLVERGLFLLGPMDEQALRAAIELPAARAGLLLEPGLVDLIVRDVLDEPGALPLMSHALQQTWAERDGRTLTVAAYAATGGIRTAVARSAEAVYDVIDAGDRTKLRDLLLRLVTPVEDGAPARLRLSRNDIAEDPGYQRLVEHLVDVRLLTSDGVVIELAHEALARAWPRFRGWLEDDAEGVRVLRHLNSAASGWEDLGRPDSELYRGERLAGVVAWRERSNPQLTAVEQAFVTASIDRQHAELHAADVQVQRERQSVRRLRRLVAGVALLAVAALAATTAAVGQRDEADDQARTAEARQLSAEALDARPHDRALLLALEAVRRQPDPEALGALLSTIGRSPRLAGVLRGAPFTDFDVAPDGEHLAVIDDTGALTLFDLTTGEEVDSLAIEGQMHLAPTFSPDGSRLAVARLTTGCLFGRCDDVAVEVHDADDLGGEPTTYRGMSDPPVAVAWSADGQFLAASAPVLYAGPGPVAVWRVEEPDRPIARLDPESIGVDLRATARQFDPAWVAFSPDAETVYSSGAGPTSALDVETGAAIASYDGLGGLALSPDGSTLAVRATTPSTARLVDTASGETLVELTGYDGTITAAAFSHDGAMVATASTDETVAVWDVTTGRQMHLLRGHAGSIFDVDFGADGATLYSSAADRSVFEWSIAGPAGLARTVAAPSLDSPSESVVLVSPGATVVAVLSDEIELVDVASGRVHTLTGASALEIMWVAFSRDGTRFASVAYDGRTSLWRTSDGTQIATGEGRGAENFGAIAFMPDGASIAVADADGTVVALDGQTLEPTGDRIDLEIDEPPAGIRTAPGGRFAVTWAPLEPNSGTNIVFGDLDDDRIDLEVHTDVPGVRAGFSDDGSRYGIGGEDGRVGVVDVETGEVRGPNDSVHNGPVSWIAFSPDGETLATLGFDGVLALASSDDAQTQARITPGDPNRNGAITFGPDGSTVLVAYRDGSVLGFDTDPASWIAHACAVAGRNLTEGEWRDAFGDEAYHETCAGT